MTALTTVSAQEAGRSRAQSNGTETVDVRIARITPSDTGVPGSVIAVTFDHTIVGFESQTLEAKRLMSMKPAVDGVFEWHDATTIRFVPKKGIAPGSAFVVSLDTAAIFSNGTRHNPAYEFSVSFRGARPLAMVVEDNPPTADWALGPKPIFRVLYSTAVNVDSVTHDSRLVFNEECGGTIAMKVKGVRPAIRADGKYIVNAGGLSRDTTLDRFRRVVELQPVSSLRPNCLGVWQVASFDPSRPKEGWRYGVRTAPPFVVKAVHPCVFTNPRNSIAVCEPDGLSVVFSAQVASAEFVRAVKVVPQIPLAPPRAVATTIFTLPAALTPRQEYTVTFDARLRDTYGRKLIGPKTFTVVAHDPADDFLSHIESALHRVHEP